MAEVSSIAGYDVVCVLGQGARSIIYGVTDANHQRFALKQVVRKEPKDQRFLDQAIQEHEIASQFDHALLRRSHKLIRQRALIRTNEVLVLMEWVEGQALDRATLNEPLEKVEIARQIAEGLGAMHEAGYVHADMKPSNVLLQDDGTIKLIDFGQSCPIGTVKERIQGTPDFIAPEQVMRREITPLTDVFNLGATLYWMLTRRHVPTLMPKREPAVGLKPTDEGFPTPREVDPLLPPALSSLVMQCLDRNPAGRPPNMKAVRDRLEISAVQFTRHGKSMHQQKTA